MPLCVINITPPTDVVTAVSRRDYVKSRRPPTQRKERNKDGDDGGGPPRPSASSTATLCTDLTSSLSSHSARSMADITSKDLMLQGSSSPHASSDMTAAVPSASLSPSTILGRIGRRIERIIDESPLGVNVEPGSLATRVPADAVADADVDAQQPANPAQPAHCLFTSPRRQSHVNYQHWPPKERAETGNKFSTCTRRCSSSDDNDMRTAPPIREIEIKVRAERGEKQVSRKPTTRREEARPRTLKQQDPAPPTGSGNISSYERGSDGIELVARWEEAAITTGVDKTRMKKRGTARLFRLPNKKYII